MAGWEPAEGQRGALKRQEEAVKEPRGFIGAHKEADARDKAERFSSAPSLPPRNKSWSWDVAHQSGTETIYS